MLDYYSFAITEQLNNFLPNVCSNLYLINSTDSAGVRLFTFIPTEHLKDFLQTVELATYISCQFNSTKCHYSVEMK